MATDNDLKPPHRVVRVQCTPSPGSLFYIGLTVVTCTAHDYSNNTASCNFMVEIKGTSCIQQNATIYQIFR